MIHETDLYGIQSPFKILAWSDRIKSKLSGVIPNPVTITIDLANKCNHNCLWCFNFKYRTEDPVIMSKKNIDDILRIVNNDRLGIQGVELTGGGEPTLNKYFGYFLTHCNKPIGITTNGELLNRYMSAISNSKISFLRISLDAACTETYKKLHGVDRLQCVLDNIRILGGIRLVKPFTLGVSFLVVPSNVSEIYTAAAEVKKRGVDYINFRPAYNNYALVKNRMDYDALDFIEKRKGSIEYAINSAKQLEDKKFKVYSTFGKLARKWNFKKCYVLGLNPVIGAQGDVFLCCERRGDLCIGNLNKNSFYTIWASYFGGGRPPIGINKCPKRCKMVLANETIERTIVNDSFGRCFI